MLLNFEDAPGGLLASGYDGFQWQHFAALDGYTAFPSQYSTGYRNGIVSGTNVAFNDNAQPATMSSLFSFDLDSAYLTGAWNDGLHVEVKGYSGGTLLFDTTYTVNCTSPTLVDFDYVGIDSAVFSSFGGSNHGFIGTGTQFVMDDLTVTIPEPGVAPLLFVGSAILLFKLGLCRIRRIA